MLRCVQTVALAAITFSALCICSPTSRNSLEYRTMFREDIPTHRPLSGNYMAPYVGIGDLRETKHLRHNKDQQQTTFTNDHHFEYTGGDSGLIYEYPTKYEPYTPPKPKRKPGEYSLTPVDMADRKLSLSLHFDFAHGSEDAKAESRKDNVEAETTVASKTANGEKHQPSINPYLVAYGNIPQKIRNAWNEWSSMLKSVRRNGNGPRGSLFKIIPARISKLGSQLSGKSGQAHGGSTNRIPKPIGYKLAYQPGLENRPSQEHVTKAGRRNGESVHADQPTVIVTNGSVDLQEPKSSLKHHV